MSLRASILTLAAAMMLSGCISLLPEAPPPPRLYPLEADESPQPAVGQQVDAVAVVTEPTGPQVLMSEGIVWRANGALAYLDGAAWPGRSPDLLQAMLAQTITRQGLLAAGVRDGEGARGDVEVRWDLIAFEIVEGADLTARFAAHVRIMRTGRERSLLHSEIVDVREPVANRSASSAAHALARAAREGSARIAEMTAEAASRLEPSES